MSLRDSRHLSRVPDNQRSFVFREHQGQFLPHICILPFEASLSRINKAGSNARQITSDSFLMLIWIEKCISRCAPHHKTLVPVSQQPAHKWVINAHKPRKLPSIESDPLIYQGQCCLFWKANGSPGAQLKVFQITSYLILLSGNAGDWTRDLLLAKLMLYHQATGLSHLFIRQVVLMHENSWRIMKANIKGLVQTLLSSIFWEGDHLQVESILPHLASAIWQYSCLRCATTERVWLERFNAMLTVWKPFSLLSMLGRLKLPQRQGSVEQCSRAED